MLLEPLSHRSLSCLVVVALLHSALPLVGALGEETSGFHRAIQQISKAQSHVDSYDVTITGKVNDAVAGVRLSDGSEYKLDTVPVAFILKMVFDKKHGKFLVARQDRGSTEWQIFGRTLDESNKRDGWTSKTGKFIGTGTAFFDPLALGLCFEGEFRRGDPWQRVVANYLEWKDGFEVGDLTDGKVRYQDRNYSIVIDTKRGHWPVEMIRSQRDRVQLKTEVKIAKVDGHWVPQAAAVMLPKETTHLSFKWHSVNQPIPEARFMRADIESRFGPRSLGD